MTQLSYAPLILASASPRRVDLLSLFGIPFETVPSLAEETAEEAPNVEGSALAQSMARLKCDDVYSRFPERFVLAADTIVCVDDEALGKPKDPADAARMLQQLSGRWHEVHTGVCLRGPNGCHRLHVETTRVLFSALSADMIDRYVRTGESMGKAGAYAIQGISGMFIAKIEGSPSNVIGLPLHLVRSLLEDAGFSLLPLPSNE